MKFLYLVFTLFSLNVYGADSDVSAKTCKITRDSFSGKFSPEELCKKYSGSFCSSMKLQGQAVCAAHKVAFCSDAKSDGEGLCMAVKGKFCSDITTIAGGICSILGGSFCDSETDEKKWKKKLDEACS